jgi:hypothetical protein
LPRYIWWLIVLVAAPALIGLASWFLDPIEAWFAVMILLVLSVLIAGWLITGLLTGLLIDEWNKMSLSRLQAVLWTILILGAFLVAATANVHDERKEPLSITIPEELWIVMGISATSLVASPLVKSTKQIRPANPDEATRTFRRTGTLQATETVAPGTDGIVLEDQSGNVIAKGQIAVNPFPSQASLDDLFKGEETSNAANLDLGKVQMFYFTLIFILAYGVSLGKLLDSGGPFLDFPALDDGMVALLGISHAAYLTNKAVPRAQTI